MTTPNLDATGHWWIGALASYDFSLEYLKGCENGAANALSHNTVRLESATVKALLDGLQLGCSNRAEVLQPTTTEGKVEDSVRVNALQFATDRDKDLLHVVDWVQAQKEGPIISHTLEWLKSPWQISLKLH